MDRRSLAFRRESAAGVSAVVEFRAASYRIGAREILKRMTLSVEAGETLVLLGRSGSGKTTALKMVNGLLFPSDGEVLVDGKATTAWEPVRLKRRIGYVIQEIGLFPHYTVAQNVGLVPRLEKWDEARIRARVDALLGQVGLDPEQFSPRYPRQLSGGQRQRVGVARALAADPSVLLFDEPFGAVDPVTRLDLQKQFLALRREVGKTAIFVTHDVREALMLATRIALLRDGALELVAPPREFLEATSADARDFLSCLDWKADAP
jgi:osmoprotectant transport system ATP-binding protein